MDKGHIPGMGEAKLDGNTWKILAKDGQVVATLSESTDAESRAKMIAVSPYMLEALKAMVELMGDEDLPDNGELSGAAAMLKMNGFEIFDVGIDVAASVFVTVGICHPCGKSRGGHHSRLGADEHDHAAAERHYRAYGT